VDFIWEWLSNEWALLIGSAVVGGIITHIFYRLKLKIEQKIRFQNTIGDEVVNALLEIRKIASETLAVEVYNVANELDKQGSRFDMKKAQQFPSIMQDRDTYSSFFGEIMYVRSEYRESIDQDVAAYLLHAEEYFVNLLTFVVENEIEDLPKIGTVFIHDIQKWHVSFDKVLIRKINNTPLKLESHTGIKLRFKKFILSKVLWKRSFLYKLSNGIQNDKLNWAYAVLEDAKKGDYPIME